MEGATEVDYLEPRVSPLIWVALIVSFFPCGILYPLNYPVREIANLLIWICAFPSVLGGLTFLTLPLLPTNAYGYFAFNLFCVLGTIGVAVRAMRWAAADRGLPSRLHRTVRTYMCLSLFIAAIQGLNGDLWLRVFPEMVAVGDGRGAGLRTEPSMLAPLLALYLSVAFWQWNELGSVQKSKGRLSMEVLVVAGATLLLTRSLSVVIILLCFLPAFSAKFRYLIISAAIAAAVGGALLWSRLQDAFVNADSFTYLITGAVGSWRNIPDILILVNVGDFLLPSNPAELRDKITLFATAWDPTFAWLENTYSTFSACASTFGVIITGVIFAIGLLFGLRKTGRANHIRVAWIALYVANWFILPKFEACGWIALALLTMTESAQTEEVFQDSDEDPLLGGQLFQNSVGD